MFMQDFKKWFLSRTWPIPALVFLLLLALMEFAAWQEERFEDERADRESLLRSGELRSLLLFELNTTLHLATGIVSYVQSRDGRINAREIEPWLSSLQARAEYIRNIGIAPDNRLTFVYPLEGNEGAIGLYYPDHPEQWPIIERIIRNGQPALDGPLTLVQGGRGLIYRIPVFLENGTYWGIVSTVIDADRLFHRLEARARELNVAFTLQIEGASEQGAFLTTPGFDSEKSTYLPVAVPGSHWSLGASLIDVQGHWRTVTMMVLGVVVPFVLAGFLWLVLRSRQQQMAAEFSSRQLGLRFATAFEEVPTGLVIVDQDNRIETVNGACVTLFGAARQEVLNASIKQFFGPDEQLQLQSAFSTVRMGERQAMSWESCISLKSGEKIDVLCQVAPLPAIRKHQKNLILQIQDIREHKRLERLKNQFVSTVSHELRTPITAIIGSLSLLAKTDLMETQPAKSLEMIQLGLRNGNRLRILIDDLLDLEKIATGKLTVHWEKLAPVKVAQRALESMKSYAEQYEVSLELTTEASLTHFKGDEVRVIQILTNFLSNAIKYSPKVSPVVLTVGLEADKVRFSVIDKGSGIPESFRSRIFQRFAQADGSDTREKGGTGLGLAICRELADVMEAEVGYESHPNVRTEFFVLFRSA